MHKYEKTKTSCLTRVNPKEDWSLENAKVIKNDKASLKEKSFSGREFIFIEKNNFVVNLFMDGMKVSEILKVIAIIYQQNLTVEAIRATLKKYNISPQAIYHSNIEKRQKSRLQKRQDFEEKKEIEQRERILKYFGNTVEEMQNFDKEFKVLPISDYRKGLYKNSSYFPLYRKYITSKLSCKRLYGKDETYLRFLDWYDVLFKNGGIVYYKDLDVFDRSLEKVMFIIKAQENLPWSINNIRLSKTPLCYKPLD